MRRLAVLPAVALLALLPGGAALADATPAPASSPRQASTPRVATTPTSTPAPRVEATPTPSPTPDPAIQALRTRIGADLAGALAKQQSLADAVAANTAREQDLNDQISASQDRMSALEDEIAALDVQIADTQDRIDVERGQVGALARALSRRPASLPLVFARSRNLGDVIRSGTELIVAGHRAHDLQVKLEADLAKLNGDRDARQADVDRETAVQNSLQVALDQLSSLMARQDEVSYALDDLISQFQSSLDGLGDQPADVAAELVDLLERQQQSLNVASVTEAWSAASVGASRVERLSLLPPAPVGQLRMITPIAGAVQTQPFGPSDLWFEPPLGKYPHFHYGVDLAAPEGTPVLAAADGVVVAVGHTAGGYGNYVILAHANGIDTLYGHLRSSSVSVGQVVTAGRAIGAEGSTGFSTGPHLHFEVRVHDAVVDPALYIPLPAEAAA